MKEPEINRRARFFRTVSDFLTGPKFPTFMILAMLFYQTFLAVTIFAPVGDGLWGKYMTDFRAWCFGYDSSTGQMRWAAAWVLLSEPLFIQGLIVLIWHKSLMKMIRFRPREIIPQFTAALALVSILAGGLLWMAKIDLVEEEKIPPFPGERIRVALQPPPIDLINQHGDRVNLSDYSGSVVLLTAIYSTCGTSCPKLLFQAKEVIEGLPEKVRKDVTVVAISLDPEADSLELMANTATGFGMDVPEFQFLNGEPDVVNKILDGLSIARIRNERTNQIDHANMYFLIDRGGNIAYRFTLSDRHQAWLTEALEHLLAEKAPAKLAEQSESTVRNF